MVANVTSELRAVVDGVFLQFLHRLPYDFTFLISFVASVGEFTEVDAIFEHFVDILQEIATSLTRFAASV